ncbi:MAG: histidine phosphatase family protein [Reyranella sp.]|uniref:histidine phosphatase family protein n=1 Tax=Reyranella sp. TaxID=1929291 RepID=UPI00272FA48F|nr:histidine phosphatase family protein [Reyranella sp.]MDP1962996.1 histidine phosphatase family protein [Reyranella sp.]MDP2373920.1 histidine phosphatase family protein [Reyranella sp.]
MMRFCLALALLAAAGAVHAQQSPAIAPLPAEILKSDAYLALLAELRQGGFVIYLRHAETAATPEPAVGDLADCSWQRNLNDVGRHQAATVGNRLKEQGIAVSTLEASPFCRTRQTAELAFGREPKINLELLYHVTQTPEQAAAANARLKARLGERPPAGGNLVLVGHSPTMKEASAVELPEGEAAIVKPNGDGTFRVVGRLTEAGITPLP